LPKTPRGPDHAVDTRLTIREHPGAVRRTSAFGGGDRSARSGETSALGRARTRFRRDHELFDKDRSESRELFRADCRERRRPRRHPAEHSFPVANPLDIAEEHQHVFAVSGTLPAFGQSVREAIGQATTFEDADTADLFTEIARGVDQQPWLVRISYGSKMNKTPRSRIPPQNQRDGSVGPCDGAGFRSAFHIGRRMPQCVGARDRLEIWVNRGGSGGEVSR
jgi:hypothetical protein